MRQCFVWQAQELLENARREAEALRDSAAAANAEAERLKSLLAAQQTELVQLRASLSAQNTAQQQREACTALHTCLPDMLKLLQNLIHFHNEVTCQSSDRECTAIHAVHNGKPFHAQ